MKHKLIFCDSPSPRSASWLIYLRFCYELSAAICRGNLLWEFAVAICRGNLSWEFAVAICRGNLPWLFAVAICRGYLPWLFAVAVCRGYLPREFVVVFSCVCKQTFFLREQHLYVIDSEAYKSYIYACERGMISSFF